MARAVIFLPDAVDDVDNSASDNEDGDDDQNTAGVENINIMGTGTRTPVAWGLEQETTMTGSD